MLKLRLAYAYQNLQKSVPARGAVCSEYSTCD